MHADQKGIGWLLTAIDDVKTTSSMQMSLKKFIIKARLTLTHERSIDQEIEVFKN